MQRKLWTQWQLNIKFASLSTTLWANQDYYISKIIIRGNRNFSYWNLTFFQTIAKVLFALHFIYTGNTPFHFWFVLVIFMANNIHYISKLLIWINLKILILKSSISYSQPLAKIFLHYILRTQRILHIKFGSIWIFWWPNKNCQNSIFQNQHLRKRNFFCMKT